MKQTLKLALVHLDVRHKECESNRKELVALGHQRWEEKSIDGAGLCRYELDTSKTRKKRFQERIDYDLLLRDV